MITREKALQTTTNVFHTQYSVPRHYQIAVDGLILLTEVGSTVHGVSNPDTGDDRDEMGICIESPRCVIGLERFEQYEYRTQPVNARSGPGDIDRVVYGLRKWAKLAAAGNPTVLMPLFAPDDKVVYSGFFGDELRANTAMFLSKQTGKKFLGYLNGQKRRYLDPDRQDSKHASRPELIEKYGWDTKTGYHALRLAIQGQELMSTGTVTLPIRYDHVDLLMDVRTGVYTKDDVTWMIDTEEQQLVESIENSILPDRPDYDRINDWLTSVHLNFWQGLNKFKFDHL